MLPNQFAVRFIQANDAFGSADDTAREGIGGIVHAFSELPVHDVSATMRNGWPGITRADSRSPEDWRPAGWKSLDDAGFAPDRIPIRPEPLRPIPGVKQRRAN